MPGSFSSTFVALSSDCEPNAMAAYPSHPASPARSLRQYFSRRHSSTIRTNDLPLEARARGLYTPAGIFFFCIKLTVPLAYVYILLILLRELCVNFPESIYAPVQTYIPYLASVVSTMEKSSTAVEVWAVVEAIFYVCLKLHIRWLQYLDPLEASLGAAPMLELHERRELWGRMMESEKHDPVTFISGWFFDEDLENISKYDILDFVTWSMFEGRNQEHLTAEELRQLHEFVDELEWRISIHMYGVELDGGKGQRILRWEAGNSSCLCEEKKACDHEQKPQSSGSSLLWDSSGSSSEMRVSTAAVKVNRNPRPRKFFHFLESTNDEPPNLFTSLYENYKSGYEQYRNMLENADFHPVQDFRKFVSEKKQRIYEVEENAMATASHMYENAYFTLVSPGSNVDKQLTALGHATQSQLTEAWNSMRGVKERFETAKFISRRKKHLQQQLKGYRLLLGSMRSMSAAVPAKQMADLMRKITQCNDAMERIEGSARDAFVKATGYAIKNILQRKEPQRYAKYSSDPLLGISTYPLMFHLLILGVTDGGLRVLMKKRGFERRNLGPMTYYYHSGLAGNILVDDDADDEEATPIVFCHGIGIGLIFYLPLIDDLLKLGRPMILPEIPYVSGFRPWQSPNSVLPPAAVSSTLVAMLATHGFLRGIFVGHSYGTSWLSYMCKYAPTAMSAVLFLDPICFCLHVPCLTKHFVYHRADPGSTSYMVRTDVIINWTIQRSFPWTRISLFTEQIPVPCSVFLSDQDALVPSAKVERYLRSKDAPVIDFSKADRDHFAKGPLNVTVFRGQGHGDWAENRSSSVKIAEAVDVLCAQIRKEQNKVDDAR